MNGRWLKINDVRKVELDWLRHGVHVRRKIEHTGVKPIRLLWIDTNMGDDVKENYRSRLVVREKPHKGQGGRALLAMFLFSGMPPREDIQIW